MFLHRRLIDSTQGKWIASCDSPSCQESAFEQAMAGDARVAVLGAGRIKSTKTPWKKVLKWSVVKRKGLLVEPNNFEGEGVHS